MRSHRWLPPNTVTEITRISSSPGHVRRNESNISSRPKSWFPGLIAGGSDANTAFCQWFGVKKNKIVGGVVRDMYMPEVRKEEVISRVTEVIDQNLELVQQIAFLLGEGASNTEKMLNSIIESHRSSEKPKE